MKRFDHDSDIQRMLLYNFNDGCANIKLIEMANN